MRRPATLRLFRHENQILIRTRMNEWQIRVAVESNEKRRGVYHSFDGGIAKPFGTSERRVKDTWDKKTEHQTQKMAFLPVPGI